MKQVTYLLLFIFLASSCHYLRTDDRIDADSVNKNKEKFKIKRVTDDQIVGSAYERGEQIANELLGKISSDSLCSFSELKNYIKNNQLLVEEAGVRCQVGQITRPKEKELWNASLEAFKQDKTQLKPSIQRLGSKDSYESLVYVYPFTDQTEFAMLSIVLSKKEIIKAF